MKIVVTTSNNYHHCVEIFIKLFNREWGAPFDLVGYDKPAFDLPDNCTWVSLGKQRGPKYFSDDLRPYFMKQDQYFVWLFEDSFIKKVDHARLNDLSAWCDAGFYELTGKKIGRICLSNEGMNRPYDLMENNLFWKARPDTKYRLSTQPSIWNKDFLLKYLTPGLNPWFFEKQDTVDDWDVTGPVTSIVTHNEGTTKHDIHKLNLEGIQL